MRTAMMFGVFGIFGFALTGLLIGSGTALAGSWPQADIQTPAYLVRVDTPMHTIAPGLRQAYVTGLQEELVAHGYNPGPIDGVLGQRTADAVRAYQRDAGLPVDGVASIEVLEHIRFSQPQVYASQSTTTYTSPTPSPAPSPAPSAVTPSVTPSVTPAPTPVPTTTTNQQTRSGLVFEVQHELWSRGYYNGAIDGIMGVETSAAVADFQADAGLYVDGEVDAALLQDIKTADPSITAY